MIWRVSDRLLTRTLNVGSGSIVLKNSCSRVAKPAREKWTYQIALQAAREHRLGVRGPRKT